MAAAAPAAAPALPNALTPTAYVGPALPAGMSTAQAQSLLAQQAAGGGNTYLPTPQGPGNALAATAVAPPVTGPSADYNAQFAKSMAAARGAVAAGFANQLAEINAGKVGGEQMAASMPGQYNALQGAETKGLANIATDADKGEAATGIKSLGSASGETGMINNAGSLASAFEAGQAPLLSAGVDATAKIQSNALAQAQTAANAQLDEQQASFDQQNAQAQQAAAAQAATDAYNRNPLNPGTAAYAATHDAAGNYTGPTITDPKTGKVIAKADGSTLTPAEKAAQQTQIFDGGYTFTPDEAAAVRKSGAYRQIDNLAGGDPKTLSSKLTTTELDYMMNHPASRQALEVYFYDHTLSSKSLPYTGLSAAPEAPKPGLAANIGSLENGYNNQFGASLGKF